MLLASSQQHCSNLIWRESAGSTNLELIQLAQTQELEHFTVLATANQVAGRGRSGRSWEAPQDSALAISVFLRPPMGSPADLGSLSWLPLIGGLAMSQTVRGLLPEVKNLGVKWPNDVLVNEHKISGLLTEMLPTTNLAVVIGAGINLTQQRNELPIPTATSLELEGWQAPQNLAERFDEVLSSYLFNLDEIYNRFVALGMNAVASGIRNQVIDGCITLGREVRAELPNGENLHGRAATIDDSGRLVLEVNGQPVPLSAADIVHLRHN